MPDHYHILFNVADLLPDIPAESIISRTLFENASLKAILFGFAEGQELSEHTASRHAILHFLQGEAQLLLGEDAHHAQAGTMVTIAPHLPHSIKANTQTRMLLYMYGDPE